MKRTLLLAILLLAAFLRFYRIDAQSFWNDEGNSARLAERSTDLIIAGAAGDIHPPGYYLLLAAWQSAAGRSEFALRGLSALAGILLVALIYRLGRQYFDEYAALGAAFFAALHPALIYYSQEARMYELVAMWGAAFVLASNIPLGQIKRTEQAGAFPAVVEVRAPRIKVLKRVLTLALLTAAGLYTHYAFAFVIIALNLLAVIYLAYNFYRTRDTQTTLRASVTWFSSQALALLLFLPWLPIALGQLTSWPGERQYLPFGESLLGVTTWVALGPTSNDASLIALAGVGGLLLFALWRPGRKLPIVLWLAVPTALTLLFGLFSQTFAKFLIVVVPAYCLLLGNAISAIFMPLPQKVISHYKPKYIPWTPAHTIKLMPLILGLLVVGGNASALQNLYFNPAYARADYRGINRYLDSIAKPGDAILLNAPNQWEVFTYYHRDLSNVFPVARSRPLDVDAQIAELETITADHDRLFVVYWGEAQSDPNRVIESWLNEHTFKAYDQWYGDVRLAAYAVPRAATDLQTRTDILLGDRIVLEGYSLNATTFSPGDILQLTLFWHATQPVDLRYKVFVHLVGDPSQPPVAQHDGEPGGGLVLTTTWQPNQTVADNHGIYLPLDLPPGDYSLLVGMYGVDDGARLISEGSDAILLATITIK